MIIKTTPQIIETYKKIYKNIIEKEEILIERTRQMYEADKIIHTTFVHPEKDYSEEVKKRFKRQRRKLGL